MNDVVQLRDVVVVGGGCYGSFYAGQLAKAKARGRVDYRTVIVVDRDPRCRARGELQDVGDRMFVTSDWDAFFDKYLGKAAGGRETGARDWIVPSPHMPHLMFDWLVRRTRARFPARSVAVVEVPQGPGTPYDRTAADHTRYVSFADWICPTHCVEPRVCPATGMPRDWEMPEAVAALAERLRQGGRPIRGAALFVCRHQVYGVGAFAVEEVREGERLVGEAGADGEAFDVLVGTVSSCHGALNLLSVGAA